MARLQILHLPESAVAAESNAPSFAVVLDDLSADQFERLPKVPDLAQALGARTVLAFPFKVEVI